MDAAVAAVLELETYLRQPSTLLPVKEDRDCGSAVVAVSRQPPREDLMQKIVEQLDKLEAWINPTDTEQRRSRERRMPANITCWSCREEGHISRNCPKKSDVIGLVSKATNSKLSGASAGCSDFTLEVRVNGVPAHCLVDTGAVATILSRKVWKKLCPEQRKLDPIDLQCNLADAQGTLLKCNGRADVKLQLGSQQFPVNMLVAKGLSVDLILGRDFLKKHQCSVELGERDFLRVNQSGLLIPLGTGNESHQEASIAVIAIETPCNPPLCEMETLAKVPAMADERTQLMETNMPGKCSPVVAARTTVIPKDKCIPVHVLNPRDGPMTQRKGEGKKNLAHASMRKKRMRKLRQRANGKKEATTMRQHYHWSSKQSVKMSGLPQVIAEDPELRTPNHEEGRPPDSTTLVKFGTNSFRGGGDVVGM